ncbi:HD-GYP domain-containing protein [Marinobacterium sediminicola]|uniref:Two-component system response regulator n=1 Tax=Marinobacterium sediminicola TaxID=518898 RepID=A0ABY1S153_9GAMM|nr:HD domain-containing phosphohydrolase [Marinobacterium sediminicola]ULG69780.1 response regulator [Marinobacterium sediminicola]SMR75409.1 putative two-component system response regulator [Marinobacterium sediminicola]
MSLNNTLTHSRILVVDDEPVNLRLVERVLALEGYDGLSLISDPRRAVEEYQQHRFDLVLLDINMPGMDGFEVLEAIKALEPEMLPPVIMLTAQHDKSFRLKALSMGVRDFITKPFDRDELLMRVGNLLQLQMGLRMIHDQKNVLEELVQQRTEELYNSRLDLVQRLGRAAEYKDEETGSHILRVSHGAALLARALGWDDEQIKLIFNASPMHDIGKLGVPDAILRKPGRLTPEEFDQIKLHTLIGAELLDGANENDPLLQMAKSIALSHHEKWDGSGYPLGLAGEAIPIEGRIVAIVDVFDALTSERPYKKSWSIEDAAALIRDNRGKHFDPELVDLFFAHFEQICQLRQQFSE